MERYYQRCLAEDSDSERQFYSMQDDHRRALTREEEKGYARGVADARSETGEHS